MARLKAATVSEYVSKVSPAARKNYRELRVLLKSVAPDATETIKWGVPVLEEGRILFSYSAHKTHINFMPTAQALGPFKADLAAYKTGKDTVQLPLDRPIPKTLIRRIAAFRRKQVREEGALWMSGKKR